MPTYNTQQFIKAIPGTGGIISQIAKTVGCAWDTAKKYIDTHPTVRQAWENERNVITDRAQHNILAAIIDGDLQMSKWWLQVKDPEFIEKRELSGNIELVWPEVLNDES
ncbi:MAG: hypothetical protein GY841_10350 [FCB group bacterium]|nr:hypothetical protein [FCB group bacterium]